MIISAVIPTFRREQLLREAVTSVLEQEAPDASVEVVVVNDAGEPLSRADWQEDPRVTLVNTQRTERRVARNTGAALSRGELLHFLDDDDTVLPGAYAALIEVAKDPEVVCAYGAYACISPDGGVIRTAYPAFRGRVYAELLSGMGIPMGAMLVRRQPFFESGGFDPTILCAEDKELLQRLALRGRFEFTDQVVERFRDGPHPLSTSDWEHTEEGCRLYREKAFASPSCLPGVRESLKDQQNQVARGRLARFYFGSGVRHALRGALLIGASRFTAGARLGVGGLPAPEFWRGLRRGSDRPPTNDQGRNTHAAM